MKSEDTFLSVVHDVFVGDGGGGQGRGPAPPTGPCDSHAGDERRRRVEQSKSPPHR